MFGREPGHLRPSLFARLEVARTLARLTHGRTRQSQQLITNKLRRIILLPLDAILSPSSQVCLHTPFGGTYRDVGWVFVGGSVQGVSRLLVLLVETAEETGPWCSHTCRVWKSRFEICLFALSVGDRNICSGGRVKSWDLASGPSPSKLGTSSRAVSHNSESTWTTCYRAGRTDIWNLPPRKLLEERHCCHGVFAADSTTLSYIKLRHVAHLLNIVG
jgi:hypothetical protein